MFIYSDYLGIDLHRWVGGGGGGVELVDLADQGAKMFYLETAAMCIGLTC